MRTFKQYSNIALLSALFMTTFFMGGCDSSSCEDTGRTAVVIGAPIITSTVPVDDSTNVPVNTPISATFSEEINPDTVNAGTTFTVVDANGEPVPGMVSYSGNNTVMIFTPEISLTYGTTYTATITTDVTDMEGNPLDISNGLNVWSFTTINEADVVPPTVNTPPIVISTIPFDGETNVPLNRTISALLSKTLDATTVNPTTFTLHNDTLNSNVSGGVVSYNLDRTVYFDPTGDLNSNTKYTATITTGVTDTNGLPLNDSNGLNEWSFTTGTESAAGPDPVNLGIAGNFTILTKTGISTTGTTLITGDIGVSPYALTAITGFNAILDSTNTFATSTLVDGKIYAADMATPTPGYVGTAVSDMETAYTDAAGRPNPDFTELYSGDLSGKTLVPGLYKWGTGVLISGGEVNAVTLDGGANDVWIFQIAQGLTVENDARVILTGGAQAKNVFWQVAGTVTIGTYAQFNGTVLAMTNIAVNTGATVDGRLLAQTAVTLDSNPVTQP